MSDAKKTGPARPDTERVWLQCMISAIGGLGSIDRVRSPEQSWGALDRELAEDAARIADFAVKEWRERYPHDER